MGLLKIVILMYIMIMVTNESDANIFQTVERWADTIGNELWDLTDVVAKAKDIKMQYKSMNTKVKKKSGEELINVISENMAQMLQRKVEAVNCIRFAAESIIENWEPLSDNNLTYTSSKYSVEEEETFKIIKNESVTYRQMVLEENQHFFNIAVNTSFSSVHVPSNVHDMGPNVSNDITWSEYLDDTFIQNYMRDPALSWQYFGSKNGILRQYPAMSWDNVIPDDRPVDEYDCRLRSWFIEASTCSKDVVILIDNSGSMTGIGRTIAKTTMASILQTLSNNDLIAVFNYSDTTQELVSCFKDKLVQATPENLEKFMSLVPEMDPNNQANLTEAFTRAFDILKKYRDIRGCGTDNPCNQIIMLITDNVPGNLTEVFKTWNWNENSTHIPVRVFTYLLGKEVTNVREIQWMACLNRGYYSHVHNQEEVREQVLKYIPVMARPLVLQSIENPVIWTHVYADKVLNKQCNESDKDMVSVKKCKKYRLITSVSVPVFEKNISNSSVKTAHLLGVAGTDVNIEDIRQLTFPYKLGINGYAFIVSNNGYIIMHPDLRPVHDNHLKPNFNSIDLTEVEILYDGQGPRTLGENVLKLREALVEHKTGSLLNVPVKLHYDDCRRVTIEIRNYFYAPLAGSQFGLAVALPKYGRNIIQVGNEIAQNQKMNITTAQFFDGDYWRIHPQWTYCRYHYSDYHSFETPEDELRHFVKIIDEPNWKWSEQYEPIVYDINENYTNEEMCKLQTLNTDDYYCDKELLELLVFEAKVTKSIYERHERYNPKLQLAHKYEVFVRFVATHSGLTRWQIVNPMYVPEDLVDTEFGDLHKRSINEPWYKGAILQYLIDPDSLYVTASWEGGENAIITVAVGIFLRDGGLETPVAAAGYQMPIKAFHHAFSDIVSHSNNAKINCAYDYINCYLVDHNGYVVISESYNETGQFFGIVEGAIMISLVNQNVYEGVEIFDYQATCIKVVIEGSAFSLMNPIQYIHKLVTWIGVRIIWYFTQFVYLPIAYGKVRIDEDAPDPPPPPKEVFYPYPCDQKRMLYVMDQKMADQGVTNTSRFCSRPFVAQKVIHTNLLLVAVNMLYPSCYGRLEVSPVTISPYDYENYDDDRTCLKFHSLNDLVRRRVKGCFTEHPREHEITACGEASRNALMATTFILVVLNLCGIL